MDANNVTVNELITQMINEARRLGFSERTIWRNWVHKAGMVTRDYRDHGVCLYDPAVTDAFVQETRQRYDAGAISKSHLKQIRQIAGRLNEFYVTGTLRIDTTMRGTRYELSSRYEHLVDLFITHQGYGKNTRDDAEWAVRKYLSYFEKKGRETLSAVTMDDVQRFIFQAKTRGRFCCLGKTMVLLLRLYYLMVKLPYP